MDLSKTLAAEQSTETEANADSSGGSDTSESEIPFEPNEGTEGYFLFSEGGSLCTGVTEDIYGYDRVTKHLSWGDSLEDLEEAGSIEAFCDGAELAKQQKLNLLWLLTKGTFGAIQGEKNEGYGMGWNSDHTPPSIYDNDAVDHVPYLDVYSDLPAFDHEALSDEEIEELENPNMEGSEGLDMDNYGSLDRGPVLPRINGERLPIVVEDGDEVQEFLKAIDSIDFDEITYCPEDGDLQGTPSLGPSDETDEAADAEDNTASETDYADFNLAANPERVTEVRTKALRGDNGSPEQLHVSNIDSLRTIQTMLRAEQEGPHRSSAIERIEQRRNALQSGEESEATESSDDSEESEWTEADKELMTTLIESGRAEDLDDAKQQIAAL